MVQKEFHNGSFHSFRHTHATMMLENNIELDYVSKRLGHSSIATTANIYDTITDKRNKEAMKSSMPFYKMMAEKTAARNL